VRKLWAGSLVRIGRRPPKQEESLWSWVQIPPRPHYFTWVSPNEIHSKSKPAGNTRYVFRQRRRSLWHEFRCLVQSNLVRAFLRIPSSLAGVGCSEKKTHQKERSERAVHPRASWIVRLTVNGNLCDISKPMELRPAKLARNIVAHVLCSHSLWLSVTQSCGKVLPVAIARLRIHIPVR
jgi:hypothetical protein